MGKGWKLNEVVLDVDVRPLTAETSLLITATGRRFEVDRSSNELTAAVATIERSLVRVRDQEDPFLLSLLDVVEKHGCLAEAQGGASRARSRGVFPGVHAKPILSDFVLLVEPQLRSVAAAVAKFSSQPWRMAPSPDTADLQKTLNERSMVVTIDAHVDPARLEYLERICLEAGAAWAQLHFEEGKAWMGPIISPARGVRYAEVMVRRRCAAADLAVVDAQLREPARGPLLVPSDCEVAWLLSLFLVEVDRWLIGSPSSLVGNELEADPVSSQLRLHPVLPLPDRDPADGQSSNERLSGPEVLIDSRYGVITQLSRIENDEACPQSLVVIQANVADMGRIFPWATNTICGGTSFDDAATAEAAAVGEAVERYCGNWVHPENVREASYNELVAEGSYAIDPGRLALYSDQQYDAPGFPFTRFTPDLPVHWVEGRSLTRDCSIWVPASIVYVNWYIGPFSDAPKTNFLYYPGIAAGASFDDAVRSGLEELVERDATMIWWANRPTLSAVALPDRLRGLWDGDPAAAGQRAWLIPLPNEFGVPVMAGVVENIEEQMLTIGFAARPDPEDAGLKAWAEALTNQAIARDLQDRDGLFWQAVRAGEKRQGFLKPWREDRAYLDDFRPDCHDVGDLECQLQVYLDPRSIERVRGWVQTPATAELDQLPRLRDRTLATYQSRVERNGFEVIAVDVTTPDVATSGLRVVRTVVPGLVPNFPAAFPFNGGGRLCEAAVTLGWRESPRAEHDLTTVPLAHA